MASEDTRRKLGWSQAPRPPTPTGGLTHKQWRRINKGDQWDVRVTYWRDCCLFCTTPGFPPPPCVCVCVCVWPSSLSSPLHSVMRISFRWCWWDGVGVWWGRQGAGHEVEMENWDLRQMALTTILKLTLEMVKDSFFIFIDFDCFDCFIRFMV